MTVVTNVVKPVLYGTLASVILLGVYLVASSYILILRPRKELQLASMRKSRNISDE